MGVNKFLLQPGVKESAAEYSDGPHNSQQAKENKKPQTEFLNLVKLSKSLAINAKATETIDVWIPSITDHTFQWIVILSHMFEIETRCFVKK